MDILDPDKWKSHVPPKPIPQPAPMPPPKSQ